MDPRHRIQDTSEIISPGLVIFADIVRDNLERMIAIAGTPERLRPHCKTHKMREIIELELEAGITRHKCATLAEAEMLAESTVTSSRPSARAARSRCPVRSASPTAAA